MGYLMFSIMVGLVTGRILAVMGYEMSDWQFWLGMLGVAIVCG